MEDRGLRTGHLAALAGAAAVLVALWLPWYAIRLPDAMRSILGAQGAYLPPGLKSFADELAARIPSEIHGSGWQVFAGADVALAAAALVIAAFLLASAGAFGPSVKVDRILAAQVAMLGGGAIGVFVVWKLVHAPVTSPHVHVLAGPWIALLGSVLLGAGGWAAARDD